MFTGELFTLLVKWQQEDSSLYLPHWFVSCLEYFKTKNIYLIKVCLFSRTDTIDVLVLCTEASSRQEKKQVLSPVLSTISRNILSIIASLEKGTLAEQRKRLWFCWLVLFVCFFSEKKSISGEFIPNTLWHHLLWKQAPINTLFPEKQII